MSLSFLFSYAGEDLKTSRHESIPDEMPERVEDLLEATGLSWEELADSASFLVYKKEELSMKSEKERLQDEKILENLDVNLKTKEEIADYLNSLSEEKLKELHHLRGEIYEESTDMITYLGATLGYVGLFATGVTGIFADELEGRKKLLFKRGMYASGSLAVLGFFIFILRGMQYSEKSLGLDADNDKSAQENLKKYIGSLTLEEARDVLIDIKKINEGLKRKIENQ